MTDTNLLYPISLKPESRLNDVISFFSEYCNCFNKKPDISSTKIHSCKIDSIDESVFTSSESYLKHIDDSIIKLILDNEENYFSSKDTETSIINDTANIKVENVKFVKEKSSPILNDLSLLLLEEDDIDEEGYPLKPSSKAFKDAFEFINKHHKELDKYSNPTILTDDRQGVRMEWSSHNKHAILVFSPNERFNSYLYFREGEDDTICNSNEFYRLFTYLERICT